MAKKKIEHPVNSTDIFLFGGIGSLNTIDGNLLAQEIRDADEEGFDEIRLLINSPGGSIIDGFSIISAIQNANTSIHGIVEGVASSMAGIIVLFCDKISIRDYGRLMVHEPKMGGKTISSAKDEKTINTLKAFRDSMATIISNRTGLAIEKVNSMLLKETWLTAKEAKSKGFVDNIIKSNLKSKINSELPIEDLVALVAAEFQTNKLNQKTNKMENILNHLKFEETKTEDDVLDYIKNLEIEADTAKSDLNNEKTEIATKKETIEKLEADNKEAIEKIEATLKEVNSKLAKQIVVQAIEDGKFIKRDEASLIKRAEKNIEDFEDILKSITNIAPVASIISQLDDENKDDEKATWTFDDYSKKDPKALQDFLDNDVETYKRLYQEQFGIEPTL